jgi:hypothetical protein
MAAEKSRVLLAILRYATARIIYGHSHDANSDAIKDFLLAIQARHDYIAQRFNHQYVLANGTRSVTLFVRFIDSRRTMNLRAFTYMEARWNFTENHVFCS